MTNQNKTLTSVERQLNYTQQMIKKGMILKKWIDLHILGIQSLDNKSLQSNSDMPKGIWKFKCIILTDIKPL